MMSNTYSKAYTEVIEIISHFSDDEYKKIPKEKIEYYENNKDNNYVFKIDPNVDLAKQNISREANAILVSIFRDYFATEKQKETLNILLKQNQQKKEDEKLKKYNSNNIFKNNSGLENNNESKEILICKVEKEKWYKKILAFFKRILKK